MQPTKSDRGQSTSFGRSRALSEMRTSRTQSAIAMPSTGPSKSHVSWEKTSLKPEYSMRTFFTPLQRATPLFHSVVAFGERRYFPASPSLPPVSRWYSGMSEKPRDIQSDRDALESDLQRIGGILESVAAGFPPESKEALAIRDAALA